MQENLNVGISKQMHKNPKTSKAMLGKNETNSKTLVLFCTYKITAGIMSEFKKMQNCGVQCVLGINNTYQAVDDDQSGAVQEKTLFGVRAKRLLLYQKELEDLGLLVEKNIGRSLWHSTDYWVYVARKYFDFDYIWTIDYDCFLNAKDYSEFFALYKKEKADLIVSHFRKESRDSKWCWTANTGWAYDESVQWCASLFSLARYSKDLATLLYEKRLEYKKKFLAYKGKKQWLMCEFFTTTEAYKNGFSIKNFTEDGHQIRIAQFDLNAERIFTEPDGKIYHCVKENLQDFKSRANAFSKELENLNKDFSHLEQNCQNLELELCKNHIKSYLSYQLGYLMITYNKGSFKSLALPYVLAFCALNFKAQKELKQDYKELLNKYKNHKEILKIKEHLSYKLGSALITRVKEASNKPLSFIAMGGGL